MFQGPLVSGFHPHQLQSSMSVTKTSLGSEMPLVLLPCLESLSSSRLRIQEGNSEDA